MPSSNSQPTAVNLRMRLGRALVSTVVSTVAVALGLATATSASAQSVRVSVDSTKLKPDARAALGVWHNYLQSKRGLYHTSADTYSAGWLQSEQTKWPSYDLVAQYLLDASSADVVSVEPATAGNNDSFRINTKFSANDATVPWLRETTSTVFVVRNSGVWRLSNALERNTASWKRDTVKTFEYIYAPGYAFNRTRAQQAVAFADSLADVFSLAHIDRLSYYLFNSTDDAFAAVGLASLAKITPLVDMAPEANHMIFADNAALGESQRHEIAHIVLKSMAGGGTSPFVYEGLPTFLGGMSGMDYPTAVKGLALWMREHPQVTLDSLMRPGYAAAQTYPAGAVVAEIVNEVGGRHGLKLLFDAGNTAPELREGLQRITKWGWARLSQEWRDRVSDYEKKNE